MCKCNAAWHLAGNEVKLECSYSLPIIADNEHFLPVSEGVIGENGVTVLRDTGCSTVAVRRRLVTGEPGADETCVFMMAQLAEYRWQ